MPSVHFLRFAHIVRIKDKRRAVALLRMVGARGFEPPTSSSRTKRATKLRYAPMTSSVCLGSIYKVIWLVNSLCEARFF